MHILRGIWEGIYGKHDTQVRWATGEGTLGANHAMVLFWDS